MSSQQGGGVGTFLINLSGGAISGAIACCCVFPIDTIKAKLQSSSGSGLVQVIKQTISVENGGVKALYRGIGPNLVGIMPEKAIKLAANDFFRGFLSEKFVSNKSGQIQQLPLWIEVASGGLAGACQLVATTPMELLKINAQLANKGHSTIQFIKESGITGLYRGLFATLMRDVPFSMIFFTLNARIKNYFRSKTQQQYLPLPYVLLSSSIAGSVGAFLATPMDVIKTRLQYVGKGNEMQNMNYFSAAKYCYQNGVLWRGALPRVMIISPLFAITLICYELFQKILGIKTV
ncbi:hypothetical protein ABK040_004080 [Willaertia magna]